MATQKNGPVIALGVVLGIGLVAPLLGGHPLGFFLEVTLGGLMAGVLYSLVALGFVLIFKASGVFNFAQGSMVLFAALALARLAEWLPGWTGIPAGFPALILAFILTTGIMIPVARTNATISAGKPAGMPVQPGSHSARRASASAANNTIAPCAKLNTPEALKISTKPSATSE